MEREIERGTDGRTLILLACGCAKVAVMSSAKEETILLDMFRAMWDAVNGTGNRHDYFGRIDCLERIAMTTRWAPTKWFTAHSVLQAAKAISMIQGGTVEDQGLFYARIVRAVQLARMGIDPLISVEGDAQLVARMNEILRRKRKVA
jgi:hypothetical protein